MVVNGPTRHDNLTRVNLGQRVFVLTWRNPCRQRSPVHNVRCVPHSRHAVANRKMRFRLGGRACKWPQSRSRCYGRSRPNRVVGPAGANRPIAVHRFCAMFAFAAAKLPFCFRHSPSPILANAPRHPASHRPPARRSATCPLAEGALTISTPSQHRSTSTSSINASLGNLRPPSGRDGRPVRACGRRHALRTPWRSRNTGIQRSPGPPATSDHSIVPSVRVNHDRLRRH